MFPPNILDSEIIHNESELNWSVHMVSKVQACAGSDSILSWQVTWQGEIPVRWPISMSARDV
jgi:hypothetical protein